MSPTAPQGAKKKAVSEYETIRSQLIKRVQEFGDKMAEKRSVFFTNEKKLEIEGRETDEKIAEKVAAMSMSCDVDTGAVVEYFTSAYSLRGAEMLRETYEHLIDQILGTPIEPGYIDRIYLRKLCVEILDNAVGTNDPEKVEQAKNLVRKVYFRLTPAEDRPKLKTGRTDEVPAADIRDYQVVPVENTPDEQKKLLIYGAMVNKMQIAVGAETYYEEMLRQPQLLGRLKGNGLEMSQDLCKQLMQKINAE